MTAPLASVAPVRPFPFARGRAVSIRTSCSLRLLSPGVRATAGAVLLLAGACRPAHPTGSAPPVRLVDDAGDTIALATPARRVVSLIPATTELLFAIGAGSTVVGRTTWCDYPPEAASLPSVGDGIRPSVEAILARHPDLVVLYHSGQNAAAAEQLRRLGIAAPRFSVDRLSDVGRVARALGLLTGRIAGADALVTGFDTALAAATMPVPVRPPRVFIVVWSQPPMTIGRGSFLNELVERAGGINLFADVAASSAEVSLEAVVSRNPDLILTAGESLPAFASRPEWQAVPAVRGRRFLNVTSSAFSRPSPRAPAAIRELAAKLGTLRPEP